MRPFESVLDAYPRQIRHEQGTRGQGTPSAGKTASLVARSKESCLCASNVKAVGRLDDLGFRSLALFHTQLFAEVVAAGIGHECK
jgi:hypothetical protein